LAPSGCLDFVFQFGHQSHLLFILLSFFPFFLVVELFIGFCWSMVGHSKPPPPLERLSAPSSPLLVHLFFFFATGILHQCKATPFPYLIAPAWSLTLSFPLSRDHLTVEKVHFLTDKSPFIPDRREHFFPFFVSLFPPVHGPGVLASVAGSLFLPFFLHSSVLFLQDLLPWKMSPLCRSSLFFFACTSTPKPFFFFQAFYPSTSTLSVFFRATHDFNVGFSPPPFPPVKQSFPPPPSFPIGAGGPLWLGPFYSSVLHLSCWPFVFLFVSGA